MHIVMLSLVIAFVVCVLLLVVFGLFTIGWDARSGARSSQPGWRHHSRLG